MWNYKLVVVSQLPMDTFSNASLLSTVPSIPFFLFLLFAFFSNSDSSPNEGAPGVPDIVGGEKKRPDRGSNHGLPNTGRGC